MKTSVGNRVLMLIENTTYPFDRRVSREAQTLYDAGYQVTVVCPRGRNEPLRQTIDGIMVYRFPMPPQGNSLPGYLLEFGYATAAIFVLTVWVWLYTGFDVIHAANPPDTLFLIGALFKLLGKSFVFDHHDLAPEVYISRYERSKPNLVYHTLRWFERLSFAVADIVIATNESYRHIALERGKKQPEQVVVVRNGPPLSFRPVSSDPELALRARYLIGYIGVMGTQDGVDYWLRAVRELVVTLNRRDFLAVIIGSGDAVPGLHALAKELEVEPYIWFTGRIPDADAKRILSTTHICVHPDPLNPLNDKSTMIKMMEYMALGKAVVSFDLTEARYSAQNAAIYAKPNDVLDFAQKVAWLMDHPRERTEMGSFGQERVAKTLAWENSAPHLLQAYMTLQSQKEPRYTRK